MCLAFDVKDRKLTSWNDKFGHFLSVNLRELQPSSIFSDIFQRQLATLQKIEEKDGTNDDIHAQVRFFFCDITLCVNHPCSMRIGGPRGGNWSLRPLTPLAIPYLQQISAVLYWRLLSSDVLMLVTVLRHFRG